MKTETLIIDDQEQLIQFLEIYELKPASSLQKLCAAICRRAKEDQINTIVIRIALDLVPPSYHGVAGMFAKTCEGNIDYPFIQSSKDDHRMVLRASTVSRPATFRARAIHACENTGIYKCQRSNVPKSYRQRPSILARIIEESAALKIAIIAKPKTIAWKVLN